MAPTKSTRPASPERPAALGAKVKTAKGLGPKVKAAVKGLGPVKGAGVVKRSKCKFCLLYTSPSPRD